MNAPGTGATLEKATPEKLIQLEGGFVPPLIVGAAVQHRVFDLLEQEPKTPEQVASESGASLRGIRALMNALIGLKLLRKDDSGRYALTPESAAFLVSGKPQFLGAQLRDVQVKWRAAAGETGRWRMWLDISDVVQVGKPAAPVNLEQHGGEYFKGFVEALFGTNYPAARALGEALDIAHKEKPVRVLDLAAGSGVWGIVLARKSPRVTVTALDWPGVLEITKTVAGRFGLLHRFQFVPGDLLSADFGAGHNIAILGHILHSEGATRSQALLKKTFAALAPGGTIAIADFLVNEDRTGPPVSLIYAVNMLVQTEEGDTFSFGEIGGWLRDAGFENPRPLENPGPSPLILATKPE
jgi:3-hydroxy-5-methyl-1-naphthoate 3-O-methyltransferase